MAIAFDRIYNQRFNRRSVTIGAAGAVVALTGAAIAKSQLGGDGGNHNAPAPVSTATQAPLAFQDQPTAAPTSAPTVIIAPPSTGVPDGMALVASPRLPLFDLASQDIAGIVSGKIPSWIEVGSAIDLAINPLALSGTAMDGLAASKTFSSYEKLAKYLNSSDGFGGIALVPADQVDARVNVLAVDGYDPVRMGQFDETTMRVGFVGDIVPGRNVGIKMEQYGDYTHPFHRVAATLASCDLTIANLEGNLSDNIDAPADPNTFSFISPTKMMDGFKMAGIDVVSLANNHTAWNDSGWGTSALLDTLDACDNYGVARVGAGRDLEGARFAYTSTIGDKTIAIIGIDGVTANVLQREPEATVNESWKGADKYAGATSDSPGTNPYDPDIFIPDIQALAADYDIVIPYFHFGIEYIEAPPAWAVEGARSAVDAGATIVVTNHPHVVQGMEFYNGAPIVYSVGNFIFDQMFSVQTREGLILELVIRGKKCVQLRTRGVEIEDFNQPRLMTGGEQAGIMDRFWASTDRLANRG